MILISHRGNISGIVESLENNPIYIDTAINNGYDVEIDIWCVNEILYLGHDIPQYEIGIEWIFDRAKKLWVHCKNVESILYFKNNKKEINYFWHEDDTLTLTSLNYIWAYPRKVGISNSIAVLPEINNTDITNCLGVCSDYIINYKL